MNILLDDNIPAAHRLLSPLGEVVAVPGRMVSNSHCRTAQALMVRSVTKVDRTLLTGTAVRFVGSATAGADHVDQHWLRLQGIQFAQASGSNAIAVVEYVLAALIWLAECRGFLLTEKTVGIVGVGHIGTLLNNRLQALKVPTLLCDPPRAARGERGPFWPLHHLVDQADVLTFHTPWIREGPHATHHLVDDALLAALPPGRILINSARGAVVDNQALLSALERGKALDVVLDVWENEPHLSLPLLAKVAIGTPHIAGYTLEARLNGTYAVYRAFCRHLGVATRIDSASLLSSSASAAVNLQGSLTPIKLKQLMDRIYRVDRDDTALRLCANQPGGFDRLRKLYPVRREWSSLRINCDNATAAQLLQQLGFRVCC